MYFNQCVSFSLLSTSLGLVNVKIVIVFTSRELLYSNQLVMTENTGSVLSYLQLPFCQNDLDLLNDYIPLIEPSVTTVDWTY